MKEDSEGNTDGKEHGEGRVKEPRKEETTVERGVGFQQGRELPKFGRLFDGAV
jgi:hypothetical protein